MTENNKVVYDGQTLIDLTQDDVTASDVRSGVYFHSADGVRGQGTLTSTSIPTADTIAEFDSSAHMNSTDMSAGDVTAFVNSLNVSALNLVDVFYPVGSYYETSDTSFNPNITWAGTTWSLETEGQVHIGGSANGTYQVSGALTNTTDGGETTHTLTVDEMPSHSHIRNANGGYNSNFSTGSGRTIPTNNSTGDQNNLRTGATGGGQAHNNMPPYIIVNRWHRTA